MISNKISVFYFIAIEVLRAAYWFLFKRPKPKLLRVQPMEKVKVELECSKETYELGKGLADFIGAVKTALADGWQLGTDVPVVISAALATLVPAVDGVMKVKDELAEDKKAFVNAAVATGAAVMNAVL
jgi:hypothetical protein